MSNEIKTKNKIIKFKKSGFQVFIFDEAMFFFKFTHLQVFRILVSCLSNKTDISYCYKKLSKMEHLEMSFPTNIILP